MSETTHERNSAWRWFPIASLGALAAVVIVNAGMIYYALHTFPGDTVRGGFEASNAYEQVIDRATDQAALGWTIDARTEGGRVVLHAVGRDGQALPNAMISATAIRPLGPKMETQLMFDAEPGATWRAETALPQAGQWDVQVQIAANGSQFVTTRRVLVK